MRLFCSVPLLKAQGRALRYANGAMCQYPALSDIATRGDIKISIKDKIE